MNGSGKRTPKRSPLALMLLALLVEAPMHPYEMQRLLRERDKGRVVNLGDRSAFYKTIERLQRDGLVEAVETARDAGRPERTVYAATDDGRETLFGWVRGVLAEPRQTFPEFPAAMSVVALLSVDDALAQLEHRQQALRRELAEREADNAAAVGVLPRVLLLEEEYMAAVAAAELAWVGGVVDDLRAGRLRWSADELDALAEVIRSEGEES